MIYKEGYEFKKAGVIVMNIVPNNAVQQNLFDDVDRLKQSYIMDTLDTVNKKMGKNTVKFAVQGCQTQKTSWHMERNMLSPCYTTRWEDLWIIKV
jgi:DNA polymerase V